MDDHVYITSILHEVLFGQILSESVGVWEIAYQFLFLICHLLNAHGHYILHKHILIQLFVIDLLFNQALSIAIDISCADLSKNI